MTRDFVEGSFFLRFFLELQLSANRGGSQLLQHKFIVGEKGVSEACTCRIVSNTAIPAVTEPPGELM